MSCPHFAAALFYTRKLSFESYMKPAAWCDDSEQQSTTHHCWTALTGSLEAPCTPFLKLPHFTSLLEWAVASMRVVFQFLPPYATKVLSEVKITTDSCNLILVTCSCNWPHLAGGQSLHKASVRALKPDWGPFVSLRSENKALVSKISVSAWGINNLTNVL